MSLASCSCQTVWVKDSSSFTTALLGLNGDLFQVYVGDASAPDSVMPDWSTLKDGNRPIIQIIVSESDPDMDIVDVAAKINNDYTKWYVNGKEIVFNSNGISIKGTSDQFDGSSGCFRKLTTSKGSQYNPNCVFGGLEIRANLVTLFGGISPTISVKVAIEVGNSVVYSGGSTNIKLTKSSGTMNMASIYCDSTDSFVLDNNKNPDVVCKVKCWRNGGELASADFTRKWFLLEAGTWVQKATTDTFTVNRDMISTFGDVKVECWSKDAQPVMIASDIQTVNDSCDGYVIEPNATPADMVLYQKQTTPDRISFAPKLMTIKGEAVASQFYFTVLNSAGVILNKDGTNGLALSSTAAAKFDLLKEVFENENEAPLVNITSVL